MHPNVYSWAGPFCFITDVSRNSLTQLNTGVPNPSKVRGPGQLHWLHWPRTGSARSFLILVNLPCHQCHSCPLVGLHPKDLFPKIGTTNGMGENHCHINAKQLWWPGGGGNNSWFCWSCSPPLYWKESLTCACCWLTYIATPIGLNPPTQLNGNESCISSSATEEKLKLLLSCGSSSSLWSEFWKTTGGILGV